MLGKLSIQLSILISTPESHFPVNTISNTPSVEDIASKLRVPHVSDSAGFYFDRVVDFLLQWRKHSLYLIARMNHGTDVHS